VIASGFVLDLVEKKKRWPSCERSVLLEKLLVGNLWFDSSS
jgi:hypothetical protein